MADLLSRLISASDAESSGRQAQQTETKFLVALMLPDNPALYTAIVRGHGAEGKPDPSPRMKLVSQEFVRIEEPKSLKPDNDPELEVMPHEFV
eukprot:SAG11_NODE_1777_length_4265_cov_2.104897_1_plen_93_part_00